MPNRSILNKLQKLTNQVKGVLRLMVDSLAPLSINHPSIHEKQVCIIRLDALGDFIAWLPIAEILCSYYGERNIKTVLIANDNWSQFASDLNLFNKVISINRNFYVNNLFYRYKINLQIKKNTFNIVLNPVYRREFYLSDSLNRVVKSTKKVGFICNETDKRHQKISDKWYTDLIQKEEELQHNVLLGYAFLDYMEIDYPHKTIGSKRLFELLENSGEVFEKGPYYVIVPGSGWKGRSWPIEKWAKLCRLISKESQMKGLILGSEAEISLGSKISSDNKSTLNLVGKTSISEMAQIISKAKFIISNETSAVHFAMQLNIPSICILGGGHYGQFLPIPVEIKISTPPILINHLMPCYGCNWQCPYQHSKSESVKCISDINVDEVFNVLKRNFSLN